MQHFFSHIDSWIFDLDNTLYSPHSSLFSQMEERIIKFIMMTLKLDRNESDHLRDIYWQKYGSTLTGLMNNHTIDPDQFLEYVHKLSYKDIMPNQELRRCLSLLPGRKIIHTNGSQDHAIKITQKLKLDGVFDMIFGIDDTYYVAKPQKKSFNIVINKANINPKTAIFFEDDIRNLHYPKELGMITVHIGKKKHHNHIDFQANTIIDFIAQIT